MLGRVFEYQSPMSVSGGPGIDRKLVMNFRYFKYCVVASVALVVAAVSASAAPRIKNVVIVHGAFVDGSGWQPVYEILVHDGYQVRLVQEPLTSLEEDVAAARRILDRQDGPCVLVAHSYGGTVITEAGTHPKVAALVYIAAHAPDEGETESGNGKKFPKVFTTPVTNPAWKLKPSWYMVARDDRIINPDLERMYAERAHSHKVEAESARERLGGESNRE